MSEKQQPSISELVTSARERLSQEVQAQSEQLGKLERELQELKNHHERLQSELAQQLEALGKYEPPTSASAPDLEKVLAAVRNLITATLPEQVFDSLTGEAKELGVRAVVFDVRGKSAWGASAAGFGSDLSAKVFRSLVIPLNQDNPFRQAYETGGHVDATVDHLKKNRNVLEKLKPRPGEPILLLPIRSAGSVSAIFYSVPGASGNELPVDALKILAEFAGAQLDRLMALSGGAPAPAPEAEVVEAEPVAAEDAGEAEVAEVQSTAVEAPPVEELRPVAPTPPEMVGQPAAPQAAGADLSQLSEAEQKAHKDAKRFAKLLVSEIELYNKAKVADGRKNKDIYRRLKSDIDRSRQTYEKRFGKELGKQFDYFFDELVKTLAANDPSLLGSDYPGISA